MADIGRNAPCPCGSGKKHKKCCLLTAPPPPLKQVNQQPSAPQWILEDDDLDALSNSVVDLIDERRFDHALAACQRLLNEHPDVVDGLERSAAVHAALGNHQLAADFYSRAFAFVTDPVRADDYEDADFYRQQSEEESRLAALR